MQLKNGGRNTKQTAMLAAHRFRLTSEPLTGVASDQDLFDGVLVPERVQAYPELR